MAKSNSTKLSPWAKDETGNVYGKLTVIEFSHVKSEIYWRCRCECGNATLVAGSKLRRGSTQSCGCNRETQGGGHGTPEYRSWREMKRRCYNSSYREYHLYGGRGIAICDRWRTSFTNFLADMGPKPSPLHSIDRLDNDGNYEPDNCRWTTPMEQGQNTRKARLLTHNGKTLSIRAWARKLGIAHQTLISRLAKGWPPEKVFSSKHYFVPPPKKRPKQHRPN